MINLRALKFDITMLLAGFTMKTVLLTVVLAALQPSTADAFPARADDGIPVGPPSHIAGRFAFLKAGHQAVLSLMALASRRSHQAVLEDLESCLGLRNSSP